MNDRLRTTLASAALLASLSVAGVAQANGGGHDGAGHGKGKDHAKACKKHGKGYNVKGLLVSTDLDQVAGADTARWGDDRWTGTVVVEVVKGNKRGRRDLGLSSYAVKNVRVVGAKNGVIPDEGTRLELIGKQTAACAPAPTTPTTPPATTPEPTATQTEYAHDDEEVVEPPEAAEPSESEDTEEIHDEDARDDKPGKGKDKWRDRDRDRDDAPSADAGSEDSSSADEDEASDEPKPVTDVVVRVVHFKTGPAAARR